MNQRELKLLCSPLSPFLLARMSSNSNIIIINGILRCSLTHTRAVRGLWYVNNNNNSSSTNDVDNKSKMESNAWKKRYTKSTREGHVDRESEFMYGWISLFSHYTSQYFRRRRRFFHTFYLLSLVLFSTMRSMLLHSILCVYSVHANVCQFNFSLLSCGWCRVCCLDRFFVGIPYAQPLIYPQNINRAQRVFATTHKAARIKRRKSHKAPHAYAVLLLLECILLILWTSQMYTCGFQRHIPHPHFVLQQSSKIAPDRCSVLIKVIPVVLSAPTELLRIILRDVKERVEISSQLCLSNSASYIFQANKYTKFHFEKTQKLFHVFATEVVFVDFMLLWLSLSSSGYAKRTIDTSPTLLFLRLRLQLRLHYSIRQCFASFHFRSDYSCLLCCCCCCIPS